MRTFLSLLVLTMLAGPAQGQWSSLSMPAGRCQHGSAASFSKIYLVGGITSTGAITQTIRVYDRLAGTWNTAPMVLSEGRGRMGCAINGDKLFCGGGINFTGYVETSTVDIFDLATHELEQVAQLSVPRTDLSAVAVGDKILFAGGTDIQDNMPLVCAPTDVVDIYDVSEDSWSVEHLSQARFGMASAVVGNKAYFAGGHIGSGVVSDRVDVYDAVAGTWSTATLSAGRAFYGGGVAVGNKVMFAGGLLPDGVSDMVDIYDTVNDSWSTATISEPRVGINAAAVGDHAIFAGGGDLSQVDWYYENASSRVDLYDAQNDEWSQGTLGNELINATAVASGNQIFIAGGYDPLHDVILADMDVFTDASTIGMDERSHGAQLDVWPNPFTHSVNIGRLDTRTGCSIEVFDARGVLVRTVRTTGRSPVDLSMLKDGLYYLCIRSMPGSELIFSGPVLKEG